MKKVLIIIKREYLTRVRTKAFMIGTVASPLLMLALVLLPGLLAARGGGERRVTILDQSGDPVLFDAIKKRMEGGTERGEDADRRAARGTLFTLTREVIPPGKDLEEVKAQYNEEVLKDTDKAYLVLPPDVLAGGQPEYNAKNASDFSINFIEQSISGAIIERRLVAAGIDPGKVPSYIKPVEMKKQKVTTEGVTEESGIPLFIIGFIMLFFIYMSILFYGIFVMRGVIEEKQSRIVEIIASSVKPTQMMLGKLIGIGLVGLTQISIWAISAMLLSIIGVSMAASGGISFPRIPVSLFIYFVIYFVLGYFLFATLYAMVGATVSSEEDAQQAQLPVTLIIVVPMMLFGLIMNNPNGTASIVLSMIPFFAPTLMLMRIAIINPPMWQVIGSMAVMIVTTLALVWVAAKIYRVGILMYGKRPSIAELGRWLRYN